MRRSRFIEEFDWRDDGCRIHPACLSCPLSECIYDTTEPRQMWRQQAERVRVLEAAGKSNQEIAETLGVSVRTVSRAKTRIART